MIAVVHFQFATPSKAVDTPYPLPVAPIPASASLRSSLQFHLLLLALTQNLPYAITLSTVHCPLFTVHCSLSPVHYPLLLSQRRHLQLKLIMAVRANSAHHNVVCTVQPQVHIL